MSQIKKHFIIFCAEYLVIIQGLLFVLLIVQTDGGREKVVVLFAGVTLLGVSLLVTKILKRIIRKKRPPQRVEFFVPFDRYAFPSAHATALFSMTLFILSQNVWIGLASLMVSVLIVIARVQSHVHDYVDIVGGFFVGVVATYGLMVYVTTYVNTVVVPGIS